MTSTTSEIIIRLGKLFKSRCFVCLRKVKAKGFTIHHLFYIQNDVVFKNYKNRNQYYQDLEPLVKANPKRFMLLCNTHHQSVERLKRFNSANFERLVKAVRLSHA